MEVKDNTLSYNIKYLRKLKNLSQEELAEKLGIKRSNIAAYESKNVEPRLRIILELARLFDVSVKTLIDKKIEENEITPTFDSNNTVEQTKNQDLNITNNENIDKFVAKSINIRKVLEGFKAFYTFKKNSIKESSPDKDKLIFDIDNFVQLMEHLLAYNETAIKAITNKNISELN